MSRNYTKIAAATITVEFDYTDHLYPGDDVLGASVTVYDATASRFAPEMLDGAAVVNSQVVRQSVTGGTGDHRYIVTMVAQTAHGNISVDLVLTVLGRVPAPFLDPDRPDVFAMLTEAERQIGYVALESIGWQLWEEWLSALEDAVIAGHAPADVFAAAASLDGLLTTETQAVFDAHVALRVQMGVVAIEDGISAAVAATEAYVAAMPSPPP